MAFFVDLEEMAEVQVGVFLGCRQAFMAQKLLNDTQVCPPAQKVGSERVAERVGADSSLGRRTPDEGIHDPLDRSGSESFPTVIQEEGFLIDLTFIDQPAALDVSQQAGFCHFAKRNHPLFFSLSSYPYYPLFKIDGFHVQTHQLTDPEPGCIQHLEHGLVP